MRLTACLIVKNEETNLARCLDSVRGIADEIVVVDTGSTDDTRKIARRYTRPVYVHKWRDSFAEARNYALTKCHGDWVLHIDADETLYREDAPLLWATLDAGDRMENVDAVVLPILNATQNGGIAKHWFPRLHKRGRARWTGIVHNQLEHQGDVLTAEIRLHHYGYALSEKEMQAKYARTERLLRKRIAEHPDDLDAWHYLIRTWHNQRRHAQVVGYAEKVLDDPQSTLGQRYAVTHDLIASLIYLGWYDEAEEMVHQAMGEMPESADWAYLAATLYMTRKQPAEAIGYWERYLELAAKPPEGFTHAMQHHYDATEQARQLLARCREMQAEE